MSLVTVIILLLLVIVVPAGGVLKYLSLDNGPYHSLPAPCATLNSDVGKRFTGDLPGEPVTQFDGGRNPQVGCHWAVEGAFLADLSYERYSRDWRGFRSSREEAHELYEFSRRSQLSSDSLSFDIRHRDENTYGNEAYILVKSYDSGMMVVRAEARYGNVLISVERADVNRGGRLISGRDLDDALKAVLEPTRQLLRDAAEELR